MIIDVCCFRLLSLGVICCGGRELIQLEHNTGYNGVALLWPINHNQSITSIICVCLFPFPPSQQACGCLDFLCSRISSVYVRACVCVCVCARAHIKVTSLPLHGSFLLGSPGTQERFSSSACPRSGPGLGTKLPQKIQRVSAMLTEC